MYHILTPKRPGLFPDTQTEGVNQRSKKLQTDQLITMEYGGVLSQATWDDYRYYRAMQMWKNAMQESVEFGVRRQLMDRYDGMLIANAHLRGEVARLKQQMSSEMKRLQSTVRFYL